MKGKLTRITDIYTLVGEDDKMIASDDVDMQKDYQIGKLSKQNCDEIFGIVDVENLAYNHRRSYQDSFEGMNECIMKDAMHQEIGFVAGFNKAMELNKDKLFTIEDMKLMFEFGYRKNNLIETTFESALNFIQSLQQPTEIEVEVEMENKIALDGHTVIGIEPKLDSNGCLILKKLP